MTVITSVLAVIPGIGPVFAFLGPVLLGLMWLGFVVLWIVLMVRAFQGENLILPIIGDLAERSV